MIPSFSSLPILLTTIDELLIGFTIGVTVWHFFIQAPFLLKLMGKEKFVPLMMQLTRLWIKTIFVSSSLILVSSSSLYYLNNFSSNNNTFSMLLLPVLGWLAVAINHFVIVPKALKAGAKSNNQRKGDNTKSLQEFAVRGGGKSETKALHQTVVLFVVFMIASFLPHLVSLNTV